MFPSSKKPSIPRASFDRCPNGHALPRKVAWGYCNPLHCADEVKDLVEVPVATDGDSATDQISKASKDAIVDTAKKKVRKEGREKLVQIPEFKDAGEAEDWTNRKKAELTPLAMAEQEYRLLYGNDDQRDSASRFILEATGHGKRDSGMGTGATIIIMNASAQQLRPWAPTLVVDAIEASLPTTTSQETVLPEGENATGTTKN